FDPRAVADVNNLRPAICRGQLASNFIKDPEDLPLYQRVVLTNLLLNAVSRPDFIAFKFEDRFCPCNRRAIGKLGLQEVSWTIRSKEDLKTVEEAGAIPIFEKFDPDV
ncbi:MAG: glycerophosphodiester phosphodiesterase, partial [Firmicutes bacterium]|nr:glycerophosphodiester phosphodiesterase [Bacillota bacterium]